MKKNYDILGLKYNSSEKKIKSVYKKLSKIYHPDMAGTGNEEMFKKINNAYKEIEKNNFQCKNCNSKEDKHEYKNEEYRKQENYYKKDNEKEYYKNVTSGIIDGLFDGFLNILKSIFLTPLNLFHFIWNIIKRIFQRYGYWLILWIFIYPVAICLFIWEIFRRKENIDEWKQNKKNKERDNKNLLKKSFPNILIYLIISTILLLWISWASLNEVSWRDAAYGMSILVWIGLLVVFWIWKIKFSINKVLFFIIFILISLPKVFENNENFGEYVFGVTIALFSYVSILFFIFTFFRYKSRWINYNITKWVIGFFGVILAVTPFFIYHEYSDIVIKKEIPDKVFLNIKSDLKENCKNTDLELIISRSVYDKESLRIIKSNLESCKSIYEELLSQKNIDIYIENEIDEDSIEDEIRKSIESKISQSINLLNFENHVHFLESEEMLIDFFLRGDVNPKFNDNEYIYFEKAKNANEYNLLVEKVLKNANKIKENVSKSDPDSQINELSDSDLQKIVITNYFKSIDKKDFNKVLLYMSDLLRSSKNYIDLENGYSLTKEHYVQNIECINNICIVDVIADEYSIKKGYKIMYNFIYEEGEWLINKMKLLK